MSTSRYSYNSREMVADCMAWCGYTKEEIDERLTNFVPHHYDRVEKRTISVDEYEKRGIMGETLGE